MLEDTDTMTIDDVELDNEIESAFREAVEDHFENFQYPQDVEEVDIEMDVDVVIFIDSFERQPPEAESSDSLQTWAYDYETLAKTRPWNVVQTVVDEAEMESGLFDVGIREVGGHGSLTEVVTRTVEFHTTEVESTWRSLLEHILEDVLSSWMR